MNEIKDVWIFNGVKAKFPSAVFLTKEEAFMWIKKKELTGALTRYPVGISVHEWATQNGHFKVKCEDDFTPEFIGNFSSAAQEHFHFEDGIFD